MSENNIPQWAVDEAMKRAEIHNTRACYSRNLDMAWGKAITAFARYIAEHEDPPVDALLIEARGIVRDACLHLEGDTFHADLAQEGASDDAPIMVATLAALRRGIELAKAQP